VNALAIKVVEFSMGHMPFAKPDMEAYLESSARFQLMINKTEGCEVLCSPMGYFLVKTDVPSHLLKQRLIVQHGLLVRDASSFRGLCGQYIRISAQKADDNNLLAGALAEAVPHLQKHIV
jgi:threonine-phosphate decarboxylase